MRPLPARRGRTVVIVLSRVPDATRASRAITRLLYERGVAVREVARKPRLGENANSSARPPQTLRHGSSRTSSRLLCLLSPTVTATPTLNEVERRKAPLFSLPRRTAPRRPPVLPDNVTAWLPPGVGISSKRESPHREGPSFVALTRRTATDHGSIRFPIPSSRDFSTSVSSSSSMPGLSDLSMRRSSTSVSVERWAARKRRM